jgi:hypothetical protein
MAAKSANSPLPEGQKPSEAATERVTAPDTDSAILQAKLDKAEAEKAQALEDAKAMEAAFKKSQELLAKAQEPVVVAPPVAAAPVPQLPRNMRVERAGTISAQYSTRWPQIRGGTCEFCGVLDPNVPAQYQYKLCPHFRGMTARCTYCPENKDPDEITYHANMNVATHPDNPGTIIMWCNSYACSDAHIKRFNKANS